MNYVVVNQHQDVQIAGAATVSSYQRKGYWIAFIGTWSECRDFVRNES